VECSTAGPLALLPYGPHYTINPGGFFLPLSALMLIGVIGSLIRGWKTHSELRVWLSLSLVMFLIIWAATPTIFWPMNHNLYYGATGKISTSGAELAQLARRWVICDWMRVGVIAVGFISSVRAISMSAR
jgi:ABC-type arginine transport system permease subunit